MKYYLAPLEGITTHIYRNAYKKHFNNIDKYFTPFIVPNDSKSLKTKEFNDLLPENNKDINVVPQILTNISEGFITTCEKLQELGYHEVNLNLGCPSATVVSKSRGSGFLDKKDELRSFLDDIYKIDNMNISIKTRLGMAEHEEFYDLINIYNDYPVSELIIHPRTRSDFYKNTPNLAMFGEGLKSCKMPVCYNGDIFTAEDFNNIIKDFPSLDMVMLGRGIIANPGLVGEIRDNTPLDKVQLKNFLNDIADEYKAVYSGDRNVLFKMKEIWSYMICIFANNKKYGKQIKKSQSLKDYKEAVNMLLNNEEIIKGAGLFTENL